MKIFVASDHAGYELKKSFMLAIHRLMEYDEILKPLVIHNLGTHEPESVDYPDYAKILCEEMRQEEIRQNLNQSEKDDYYGILLCGTGIGMSIAANRNIWIRAALCHQETFVELSRRHNNANVLVLPAKFINTEDAISFIKKFITTKFEGGRHQRRINKL